MNRRGFIAGLGGAVACPAVVRPEQAVMSVIAVLSAGTAHAQEPNLASFRDAMRELGYVEGSNVRYEFRFADGYLDRLPDLAVEAEIEAAWPTTVTSSR